MTTLRMPDLGTVEGSVTLVRWLKREGDTVSLGEPLFEVETDKGVSEVECAAEGTLAARLVAEGATVAAGDPIASIRGSGEQEQSARSAADGPASATPAAPAPRTVRSAASALRGPAPAIAALAGKYGVDLALLKGTGPGGAITRQDVLQARDAGRAETPAKAPARSTVPVLPLVRSQAQSIVASRVSQSHREKPVFHVTARVDMSRVITERGTLRFDAYFVKASAAALVEFPAFRRYILGQTEGAYDSVDVAIAIGIDDELYAPAVRGADRRSVKEISTEIDRLSEKARAHSLAAVDSQGSCFLVSNLGMYPVESFDAVILPEHSAALAVGAAIPTPISAGVGVHVAALAAVTLSVDHRLINGIAAARFLARVKQLLEDGGLA
jgi:pyruvate dehydrogenase E2 component (dihydrolipoamide acetyltransferase)